MTSSEVSYRFWAIALDWNKIQAPKHVHCVCLVKTDRLICNMTFSGQVMTLTWGQISNLTFWGQTIYHSTRLDQTNTMVCELFLCHIWNTSYCRKTISMKNGYFDLAWPLEAKPLTWPKNGWHQLHWELKELSNVFFRAFLALLVSELKRICCMNMPKFRKFWSFWPLVTSFLTWSKNWLK